MDVITKIAKSLGSIDLGLLIGIGVFVVYLILLILKGSILQTGLKIFTKKKYDFYFIVIPTFLAILTNVILLGFAYLIITAKFDINIIEVMVQYFFHSLTDYTPVLYIILAVIISEALFITIQAFILKLVTFDLIKSIKILINKISQKISKKGNTNEQELPQELEETKELNTISARPTFVNGLLAGLFCFSIMFFLTIILLYIGELIGGSLNL